MTRVEITKFRDRLQHLATKVHMTASAAEEQARQAIGEAEGDLSHTPIHLGDVGSELAAQELSATLLENEQYLSGEILAALDRIERGTFGQCENCHRPIAHARLKVIPYTRFCMHCASTSRAGCAVNLDEGRPANWEEGIGLRAEGPPVEEGRCGDDPHAAGTPGGGTAVGGLAGTNIGAGDPENADLESAMGSGNFDVALEGEQGEQPTAADTPDGYSGQSGGAVGGTPANKRATGGKH